MSNWSEVGETECPVARAMAIVGDRWTVLILRELFLGSRRFDDIQAQTGASSQMLTTRLRRLEADGLVARTPYSQRPPRFEYRLTEKGKAFQPVIFALRAWGETWCKEPGEELAVHIRHRSCGSEVDFDGHCRTCGTSVPRTEMIAEPGPGYAAERARRQAAYRRPARQ